MKKKILISVLVALTVLAGIALSASAATAESGTISVNWNKGYCVIAPTNGRSAYLGKDYTASGRFSATDVFTVPKAGTKLTWTDSGSIASNAVLTVSSWKKSGNTWVIDSEGAMFMGASGSYNTCIEAKKTSAGVVQYTYITSKDNENLRICINSDKDTSTPVINYSVTGEEGTWHEVQTVYPTDPASPVPGATAVSGLKWYNGYVASASHSSAPNAITDGSSTYAYSSLFSVPKAGTTVYFYDDLGTDAAGTKHASSNVYGISSWKKNGSNWEIDLTGDNVATSKLGSKLVGDYMLYYYTTTVDNQNLRITYAAGLPDFSLIIRPYTVWLAEEVVIDDELETGVINTVEYKNIEGETTEFKIYLPNGYEEKNSRTIFVFGTDTAIIDSYVAKQGDDAVVLYNGTGSDAARLLDTVVGVYGLNKYRVFAIGNSATTDACKSLLAGYLNSTSSYASTDAILEALFDTAIPYHDILEGITLYAMGDSYFGGSSLGIDNTWVNRMGDRYLMSYINYGIGGSTISNYVTDRNPMVVRYKNMSKVSADVILLEGGRNDRSQAVPLGTNNSRDSKTFKGALNIMIDDMLTTYPDAIIILVTCWNHTGTVSATGFNNVTYANAMRELALYRNDPRVSCLYAADSTATGVNMNDANFRAQYCVNSSDVSHLNLAGMKMVQPYMENFIAERLAEYEEYLASQQPGTNPDPGTPPAPPITTTGPASTTKAPTTTKAPATTTTASTTKVTSTIAPQQTTAAPSQQTTAAPSQVTTTAASTQKSEGGCGGEDGNDDAVLGLGGGLGMAALASIALKDDKKKRKKK